MELHSLNKVIHGHSDIIDTNYDWTSNKDDVRGLVLQRNLISGSLYSLFIVVASLSPYCVNNLTNNFISLYNL